MSEQWTGWTRNVIDEYKDIPTEQIKEILQSKAHSFAVLMEQWQGDFNFSTLVRNANAFNAKEVFYLGRKKWDRRGAVGTHHYININYLGDDSEGIDNLLKLKEKYHIVAIENNSVDSKRPYNLIDYKWPKNSLMIFGEEGQGVSPQLLALADDIVEIKQFGSVRSLNVGTTSGIIMNSWCGQHA